MIHVTDQDNPFTATNEVLIGVAMYEQFCQQAEGSGMVEDPVVFLDMIPITLDGPTALVTLGGD